MPAGGKERYTSNDSSLFETSKYFLQQDHTSKLFPKSSWELRTKELKYEPIGVILIQTATKVIIHTDSMYMYKYINEYLCREIDINIILPL